jgi:hypothetical protein
MVMNRKPTGQTNQQQPVPVQVLQGMAGSVPASSLFGMPGVTQWTEQRENLDQTVTTLSQTSQVDTIFASNFKQSDVVMQWVMEVSAAVTYTAAGATFALSPRFPYNVMGPLGLNFQNQFDTINLPDGFSAAWMQAMRPSKWGYLPQFVDQNPIVDPYSTQTSQITLSTYSTSVQPWKFSLDLLPGIMFNSYYDLEEDGRLYSHKLNPIKAWVTPQLMSGTNRIITPRVRWNPGISTTADGGPVTATGGAPTFTGAATLGFRRKAIYQPANANDTPPVFNWQYSRDFRRISLAGVSSIDIPVPQIGQILSLSVVMWDPTLNAAVGGPVPLTNIKECDLIYGSGLFKFQDTALQMQRRFFRQHYILPPDGIIVWDMAISDDGQITNSMALNTLTTSSCTIHIDFVSTTSATTYANLLIESLRYVSIG